MLETSITLFNYSASQIRQQHINLNSTKSQLPYVIPLYVSRECEEAAIISGHSTTDSPAENFADATVADLKNSANVTGPSPRMR